MFSGKHRPLDKHNAMTQGGKARCKRTAGRSTPNNAHVCANRLHDFLDCERVAPRDPSIAIFKLG